MILSYYDDLLDYVYGLAKIVIQFVISEGQVTRWYKYHYNDEELRTWSGSDSLTPLLLDDSAEELMEANTISFNKGLDEFENALKNSLSSSDLAPSVKAQVDQIILDTVNDPSILTDIGTWVDNNGYFNVFKKTSTITDKATKWWGSRVKFNAHAREVLVKGSNAEKAALCEDLVNRMQQCKMKPTTRTKLQEFVQHKSVGTKVEVEVVDVRPQPSPQPVAVRKVEVLNAGGKSIKVKNARSRVIKGAVTTITVLGGLYAAKKFFAPRGNGEIQVPLNENTAENVKVENVEPIVNRKQLIEAQQNGEMMKRHETYIYEEWFELNAQQCGRHQCVVSSYANIVKYAVPRNSAEWRDMERAFKYDPRFCDFEMHEVLVGSDKYGGVRGCYAIAPSSSNGGSLLSVIVSTLNNNSCSNNWTLAPATADVYLPNLGRVVVVPLRRKENSMVGSSRTYASAYLGIGSISSNGEVHISRIVEIGAMNRDY